MSHQQQQDYVKGLVGAIGGRCRMNGKAILELGSYNINGSVRELLFMEDPAQGSPGRYVGVDHRGGPGVDHVSLFHEIPWVEEFDVLISCNAFEHDPYWKDSIKAGLRALKPGGEIILMCAGTGYASHEVNSAPWPGYYENIDPQAFAEHLAACGAQGVTTVFTAEPDIGFHGVKLAPQSA